MDSDIVNSKEIEELTEYVLDNLFKDWIALIDFQEQKMESKLIKKIWMLPIELRVDKIKEEINNVIDSISSIGEDFIFSHIINLIYMDKKRNANFDEEDIIRFVLLNLDNGSLRLYKKFIKDKDKRYEYYLNEIDLPIFQEVASFTALVNHLEYVKWLLMEYDGKDDDIPEKTKKAFNSDFSKEQLISLFDVLKGVYISTDSSIKHFIAAFQGGLLPSDFDKIKWENTEPLFCCLIYGYEYQLESGDRISFKGIGVQGKYKTAMDTFTFKTKTNNKTLSSTIQKITRVKPPDGLIQLDRSLKAVLK